MRKRSNIMQIIPTCFPYPGSGDHEDRCFTVCGGCSLRSHVGRVDVDQRAIHFTAAWMKDSSAKIRLKTQIGFKEQ